MSVSLSELVAYIDDFLSVQKIKDYCPNGLQVEGADTVSKIVGGVTASQALIDKAVELNADAILVHHGYFWKGEPEPIVGIKHKRIKTLIENNLSLLAYHLPLDMHPEVGNNVQLLKQLGFVLSGSLEPSNPRSVGVAAKLPTPMSAQALIKHISDVLGRECVHIGDEDKLIESIGVCTGAAQGMIEHAVNAKLDAYLSGEISEPTVHISRESGVNYFSAGHHATEKGGVRALGSHLVDRFGIDFQFVDIDNPV